MGGRSHFSTQSSFGILPDEEFNLVVDLALGFESQMYVISSAGNLFHTDPNSLAVSSMLGPDDILVSGIFGYLTVVTPLPGSLLLLAVGLGGAAAWVRRTQRG